MRVLSLLCILLVNQGLCVIHYDGYQVWRFHPENEAELDELKLLKDQVDFWIEPSVAGNSADIMFSPDQLELATALSARHEVFIEDVQTLIKNSIPDEPLPKSRRPYDTNKFYTLQELNTFMAEEAATCGALCNVEQIGVSYELNPMNVMQIMSPNSGMPNIWIDGGIHAREWLSLTVPGYMIDRLINDYGTDPLITEMRDNFNWHIMPAVNPDGYEYTWTTDRVWRKTRSPNSGSSCIGTDGNRNYPYQWQSSSNPCTDDYTGAEAESESEIASIVSYVAGLGANTQININFHTYAQMLVRPWGYTFSDPVDVDDLIAMGQICIDAINANSNLGPDAYIQTKTQGDRSGMSIDWAKGFSQIKYSYTLELRDRGDYGFIAPVSEIEPTCFEASAGVFAMAQSLIAP